MDNLSHSVVGLAAAELIHRSLPSELDAQCHRLRRRLLLVSCWLASNFPDLDIVLTPLLPAPLGYLLHHRGHTHTLLYALPQALLIWAMIWLFWPSARRLLKENSAARKGFVLTLIVGFGLHMLMDYLNSYGIHPFHPYDSRWLFGDMVFILEPVFWVAFGIPVAMTVQRRWPRAFFVTALIGLPLFFTLRDFLLWASFGFLIVVALVLGMIQHRAGARGTSALILAAVVSIAFVGVQRFASSQARLAVAQTLKAGNPESRLLDSAMTPFPTNPLCWTFVSIESNESAGTYRLRRGLLSLAPETLPVANCPAGLSERPAQKEVAPAIAFLFEHEGDLKTLRALKKENCYFEAWLRFARAPLLNGTYAWDLRFSSTPRGNFTTMNLEEFKNRECSRYIPGWDFPRADLLTPSAPNAR
jgi:inner membrane protein